jgi:hypothetical protein
MAAGLGFKTFTTGEVLTAADTNGYLMQGILVFASAAARDAAITSPQEGQFAYLKDTNVTTYYTGSAWANVDTTGMTNPMTTTGDIIYSSSGSTPARLGIGTIGQVLTVNSGATAPEWATPAAGGGMTQLATGSMSGTTTTITSISGSYKNLELIIRDPANSTSDGTPAVRINGDTSGVYGSVTFIQAGADVAATATSFGMGYHENVTDGIIKIVFTDYANTSTFKMIESRNFSKNTSTNIYGQANWGLARITSAITEINLIWTAGQTWNAGTYILYGVS